MPDTTIMRAAVLAAPQTIRIDELPLPEPGRGKVRLKLEGCGVCASNLGPWSGPEWLQYPGEAGGMGHEGWGVIEAIGDGVEAAARRGGDHDLQAPTARTRFTGGLASADLHQGTGEGDRSDRTRDRLAPARSRYLHCFPHGSRDR